MSQKIDVYLLAAGEASRMFPLNQIMEKSMLPVDGKPVIRHTVDKLKKSKYIDKIYIATLLKYVSQFYHEFRDMKKKVDMIYFETPMGTASTFYLAYSYKNMRKKANERPDWIMLHYADCMTDLNYDSLIETLQYVDKGTDAIIALTGKVKHDYSEVTVIGKSHGLGRVTVFKEKPEIASLTWTGIALFKTSKMNILNAPKKDIASDIFPMMIENTALKAHVFEGYWYDIGNLNSYRKVCKMFTEK